MEAIHQLKCIAQGVTTLKLVLNLTKDFPNLVFDGIWASGTFFEAIEIGKQLAVNEVDEVITNESGIVVDAAVVLLRSCPY